jgi:hypothetical protein
MADPQPLLEVQIHNEVIGELIAPIDPPNMCKWCLIYSAGMGALIIAAALIWLNAAGNL